MHSRGQTTMMPAGLQLQSILYAEHIGSLVANVGEHATR